MRASGPSPYKNNALGGTMKRVVIIALAAVSALAIGAQVAGAENPHQPKPPKTDTQIVFCLNNSGRVEPKRAGAAPQVCAHPGTDYHVRVEGVRLP